MLFLVKDIKIIKKYKICVIISFILGYFVICAIMKVLNIGVKNEFRTII